MSVAIIAGLFGLFGTIIGAGLTTLTAKQTADRSERRAREEARRQEFRSVVIGFASTLLEQRRAAASYYNKLGSNSDVRAAAGGEAYRTRVAVQSAYYELLLTTDDPETINFASLCMEAVTKIREGESQETVDDNHQKTQFYLGNMIAAARKAQPGAFEGFGGPGRIAGDQGQVPVEEARTPTF
jgi:hypothetical protein